MLIIGTFQHSVYLELALRLLEQKGISKDHMMVAPLDKQMRPLHITDLKIVHQDGRSQFDKAFILATIGMLLGAIYGFILALGPIIWALIGILIGGSIGFLLDYVTRAHPSIQSKDSRSEVVVMIQCDTAQSETVEGILWTHQAQGICKIDNASTP